MDPTTRPVPSGVPIAEFLPWVIAVVGWILWILTHRSKKKDSQHAALTAVLEEFVHALRYFNDAANARRSCEELKRAFPTNEGHNEAKARINQRIDDYGRLLTSAKKAWDTTEALYASRKFRFPESLEQLLTNALEELLRLGQFINSGNLDTADVQQAKVVEALNNINRTARGWRPTSLLKAFRGSTLTDDLTPEESEEDQYHIPLERMNRIHDLIMKVLTDQAQNSFAVHPPKEIVDDPEIIRRDSVMDELRDKRFKVVLQDGTSEVLSFLEMMTFAYQLLFAKAQKKDIEDKLARSEFKPTEVSVRQVLSPKDDVMRPEIVKALLEQIEFSTVPCDSSA